jgi:hypothetical protein
MIVNLMTASQPCAITRVCVRGGVDVWSSQLLWRVACSPSCGAVWNNGNNGTGQVMETWTIVRSGAHPASWPDPPVA